MSEEAFIYEAIRTPRGKQRGGSLNEVKPLNLVVGLIEELRSRFPDLDENLISDVILGCVSPVGDQGADIARTAVIAAGMPDTVGGVQLNRFCASGLEAVNTAAQKVRSGWDDMVLAGGVEVDEHDRWAPTAVRCSPTRPPCSTTTSCRRASAPT